MITKFNPRDAFALVPHFTYTIFYIRADILRIYTLLRASVGLRESTLSEEKRRRKIEKARLCNYKLVRVRSFGATYAGKNKSV